MRKKSKNNLFLTRTGEEMKNSYGRNMKIIEYKNSDNVIVQFDTLEEAFYSYKNFKERYIKQVANEYKDKIPQKVYDAMYRYEIKITD